jgi:hypothetical protein
MGDEFMRNAHVGCRLKFNFDIELLNIKEDDMTRSSFRRKNMDMSTPTINVRHAADRGAAEFGCLASRHSFSFGHYYDPEHMGFRALRVINNDRVHAGQGFGTHPHRNMEIISIVVEGALEHRDSLGSGSVIRPGEAQRMSAGTGVQHSEFNPSLTDEVRFLQIWIEPEKSGLEPSYEQRAFLLEDNRNGWTLNASRDGREGSLTLHQNVALFRSLLAAGALIDHRVESGRHAWIQVISGEIEVNRLRLQAGDGGASDGAGEMIITGIGEDSDLILFDLS